MNGIVTINTDASYHSGHKVGAYSFWIVSDFGRVCYSGVLKQASNPTSAECMCIINSLVALKKQKWEGLAKIIINTDSLNATYIFKREKSNIERYRLQYGDNLFHFFRKSIIELPPIEFRHVKAHTTNSDARSWVNNWCDEAAKKQLWNFINAK